MKPEMIARAYLACIDLEERVRSESPQLVEEVGPLRAELHALLMHSLKKAHLFTTESVSSLITNENIVEVYNLDHVQLFRSINFFDLCNYSLLDLLARQWFELFERLDIEWLIVR